MNFTQPQDFQYVQGADIDGAHPYGDLNRIEIDNDIMPVRNTEDKRKLRGIDIAFLMEAVEERARLINLQPITHTFSKSISLDQINGIISRLNNVISQLAIGLPNASNKPMVFNDTLLEQPTLYGTSTDSARTYSFNYDFTSHLETIETVAEITDSEMILSKVVELFETVKSLHNFVLKSPGSYFRYPEYAFWIGATYSKSSTGDSSLRQNAMDIVNSRIADINYPVSFCAQRVSSNNLSARAKAIATSVNLSTNSKFIPNGLANMCDLSKSRIIIECSGSKLSPISGGTTLHCLQFSSIAATENMLPQNSDLLSANSACMSHFNIDDTNFGSAQNYISGIYPLAVLGDRTRWDVDDDAE